MTIAICIEVNDGIILCADSAVTLSVGGNTANVYNNANKITNLIKGLPIGFMSWAAGNIGRASVTTLAKDLRQKLTSHDANWRVDPDAYRIEDVAKKTFRADPKTS